MSIVSERCIQIANPQARAKVYPERGLQLLSFQVKQGGAWVEAIHAPSDPLEPADRRYGNPILFPAVGVSNGSQPDAWNLDGKVFPMPPHGWARNVYWQVTEVSPEAVTAVLVPHPGFKLGFPFDFRVQCIYRLEGSALRLQTTIENMGSTAFPYALGFHPYLRAPRDAVVQLPAGVRVRSEDGWRTHRQEPAIARSITLEDAELPTSILLADTGCTQLEVHDVRAGLATRVSVESSPMDYPVWVIWNAGPEAPYVCLEPWTDAPNALNRSGTRTLNAGASHVYQLALSLRAL